MGQGIDYEGASPWARALTMSLVTALATALAKALAKALAMALATALAMALATALAMAFAIVLAIAFATALAFAMAIHRSCLSCCARFHVPCAMSRAMSHVDLAEDPDVSLDQAILPARYIIALPLKLCP